MTREEKVFHWQTWKGNLFLFNRREPSTQDRIDFYWTAETRHWFPFHQNSTPWFMMAYFHNVACPSFESIWINYKGNEPQNSEWRSINQTSRHWFKLIFLELSIVVDSVANPVHGSANGTWRLSVSPPGNLAAIYWEIHTMFLIKQLSGDWSLSTSWFGVKSERAKN